jgi:hypothetical protein
MPQVGFETPHHHGVEFARAHRDATCKALRVEDFEQAGEGVGVAVVWRRRQEQAMLETLGKPANCEGKFAVDRVACAAGRRCVMCLI